MKSMLLSFIPCTPRRQQTNNLTGPRKVEDAFKNGIPYQPPEALLKTSGIDWEFQPHPKLYDLLGDQTLIHYKMYSLDRADKTYVGTFFYLGGAGTGKSRHGTEFANSVREAIKKHSQYRFYEELTKRLEDACVFHVSFENGTPLLDEERPDPWNAIGIRMLAQLLGQHVSDVREQYVADPRHIFRLVAKAKNQDYFDDFTGILVVDGIQGICKNTDDEQNKASAFYQLLVQISALSLRPQRSSEFGQQRTAPFILTCVTAKCYGPIHDFLAYTSSRRIYLPLNQLKAPVWKGTQKPVIEPSPFTNRLVEDVGGHGRAMELLAELLDECRTCPISEFADKLSFRIEECYEDALKPLRKYALPITQAILSRQTIQLSDCIPGSDYVWEKATMPGLIWVVREGRSNQGYLVAPYVWLWMMARMSSGNGMDEDADIARLRQFLRDWKFNDYEQLYGLLTGDGEPVTWQAFEKFCCNFRILRSLGFGDKEKMRLSRLHRGCKLRDDRKTMVVNRHLTFAEAEHRYRTDSIEGENSASGNVRSAEIFETNHGGNLGAEAQLSHVSAKAGDFFLSLKTLKEGQIVREVGQCKLIKEKLSMEEYNVERAKSAGKDDFFLLYTPTEVSGDIALPDRCGIVDHDCWDEYFGPFAGRAFLASRYSIKGQIIETPHQL